MTRLPNSEPISIKLPKPWVHAGILHHESREELDSSAGIDLPEGTAHLARWDELVNSETGVRAQIRVHLPEATQSEATISAVLFNNSESNAPLKAQDLRGFPLAAIAQAYVDYEYRVMHSYNFMIGEESGFDPSRPLGRPSKGDPGFYGRLAVQYLYFQEHSSDPTQVIADLSDAPRGTVKRWLSDARRKGLLPPGKPGRIASGTGTKHAKG